MKNLTKIASELRQSNDQLINSIIESSQQAQKKFEDSLSKNKITISKCDDILLRMKSSLDVKI